MTDLTKRTIPAESGVKVRIASEHSRGGQGIVYSAAHSRHSGFAKQLTFTTADEREQLKRRGKFLVAARLYEWSSLFAAAPSEWFECGDAIGHFAAAAPGKSLESLIENEWAPDFIGLLQAADAVAYAIHLLHERGWGHGDLHAGNIFVEEGPGGVLVVTIIDYDNFYHASMPAPQNCIGQLFYLAPEQRVALTNKAFLPPDQLSERYMLAVLLHTLILLCHPAHDAANDPDRFNACMTTGKWIDDPACGLKSVVGGYPSGVLNARLQNMFRTGLSLRRDERPTPHDWAVAFDEAVKLVFICRRCGNPAILDRSKSTCPFCGKRYPTVGLVLADGRKLPIEGGGRRVGRDDLGGASSISRHHANFERFGGEIRVINYGCNGLFRRTASGCERLPEGVPVAIQPGDRLRFADAAEVLVKQLD